jgi:P pilus assembly chaperone PapD
LNIRTRIGIPIFLQPEKPGAGSRLDAAGVREGLLQFSVRNTGNVHVNLAGVRVTGLGHSGDPLFERQSDGWYVLAGDSRNYEIEVPEGKCRQIARIVLEARVDGKTLVENLDLPPAACGKTPALFRETRSGPSSKVP